MDPPLPENVTVEGVTYNIAIPRIEAPEEEPLPVSFLNRIWGFFESLIAQLRALLGI